MFIVQNNSLIELPDDVPLPQQSQRIEPPEEFLRNPQDFRLEKGALVHAPRPATQDMPRLTAAEIAQIKEALKSGLFKAVSETPDRRKKKEEK